MEAVAASLQTPVLFTLAENLAQMELNVAVDEADVGIVREQQPAIFQVDAYAERSFPARISQMRFAPQTVDGIGIMNIMLVSVTERTREIGIRLANGALERDVLTQFLVEAVTLSSLGGIIGILLAVAATWGLAGFMNIPAVFNPGIMFVAFVFSAAVGIIFGYVPARKASRLDPIDALRHE